MVYTKLLFNNIKNYTPKAIKTIPYAQAAKQSLVVKANQQYLMNRTPFMKSFYSFIKRWAYGSVPGQIFIYYGLALGVTYALWMPILNISLDRALQIENAYKKKMEEEEEDDDEEEDEDDEEEEDDE